MESFNKIKQFSQEALSSIKNRTQRTSHTFISTLQRVEVSNQYEFYPISGKQLGKPEKRIVEQQRNLEPDLQKNNQREIQLAKKNEKVQIMQELENLKEETDSLVGQNNYFNLINRRKKLDDDLQARKKAEQFIKIIRERKKDYQKKNQTRLKKISKQNHSAIVQKQKKQKEDHDKMLDQKREAIRKRMQDEEKRKLKRQIIEEQSNKIIAKIKKEQKAEVQALKEIEELHAYKNRTKILRKRKMFNIEQIQQHEKRYNQFKKQAKKQEQQKLELLQFESAANLVNKYQKSKWLQRLQSQQRKKKRQIFKKQEQKKVLMQNQFQYSSFVRCSLPGVKNIEQTNNSYSHDNNEYKKSRQIQLRMQTSARIKQFDIRKFEKSNQQQIRVPYHNYLGRYKVNRGKKEDWEKVVQNNCITREQKHQQLKKKVKSLDKKAQKFNDDEQENTEEAISFYINSIDTKLAILTKI